MVLFPWSDSYSVGNQQFDSQHKVLIGLINDLSDAMKQGKGKDILGKILSDLVNYTKTHFAEEERLMMSTAYPNFMAHKMAHDKFTAQVVDFQQKYQAGNTLITLELMNMLKDWLIQHIQGVDKQYTPHFTGKGIH